MTKEERMENLKKIDIACDEIESRLRQMDDTHEESDEEWMAFQLAFQGLTQMRMYMEIVGRYTLQRA